ncbi:hypothetical protein M0657_002666 [Pyricularia oryzae]|nr:hypothetical protein M9X92_002075 [Pyricularia oryzae]KAI7928558.1 hypothetical protein M0657_002666 [Pyricularia oryzae]
MGWAAVSVPQNRGPLLPHRLYRHGRRDQAKQSGGTQPGKHVIQTQRQTTKIYDYVNSIEKYSKDDARTWAEIPKAKRTDGGTAALSSYNQSPSQICFGTPASTQFLPIC